MIRAITFGCLIAIALAADTDIREHEGHLYKKGDRLIDDYSQQDCSINGMVKYTKMRYRRHHTQECSNMKVKQDTCDYKDKVYKKGDRFIDDCNRCFCGGDDIVGCSRMMCRHHSAPDYSKMKADTDIREHEGHLYKKGDRLIDDCSQQDCSQQDCSINGMVKYTKMRYRRHHTQECSNMKVDKDGCEHKGKLYKKGDRFMDDCNHCFCAGNDIVGCTRMMCRHHPTPDYSKMEAEIYKIKTCEWHGEIYSFGDHFKDDCNHCFCPWNGNIACTEMTCINKQQQLAEQKTCTLDGKTYNFGDRFMKNCNRCFCGVNGNIGCTEMLCIHPRKNPYLDSETCNVDGKVYKKGDNFSIDGGCNACFCGGNDIVACTRLLCVRKEGLTCKYSIE